MLARRKRGLTGFAVQFRGGSNLSWAVNGTGDRTRITRSRDDGKIREHVCFIADRMSETPATTNNSKRILLQGQTS